MIYGPLAMAAPVLTEICYVDFHGDLERTACDKAVTPNYENTTIYLSSTTCPACQIVIQARLALLAQTVADLPQLADAVSLRNTDGRTALLSSAP
jgi:hypothetical protein